MSTQIDPTVLAALMKAGFTRADAVAFIEADVRDASTDRERREARERGQTAVRALLEVGAIDLAVDYQRAGKRPSDARRDIAMTASLVGGRLRISAEKKRAIKQRLTASIDPAPLWREIRRAQAASH